MKNQKKVRLDKEVKDNINRLITEFLLCDNANKILREISNKIDRINIDNPFDYEAQLKYSHLVALYNMVIGLRDKSIHFTKSALSEYRDNHNPIWVEIVKRNIA